MNYGIYIIIGCIIVPMGLLLAYYQDYKQDKVEFKNSLKNVGKKLTKVVGLLVMVFAIKMVSEFIIPFNKNHGVEYNSEREKYGVPIIGVNWKIDTYYSGQFETQWWKPKPTIGRFKKVIEYGLFSAISETDYYQNPKFDKTYIWSKYDYDEDRFEYFVEKPNDKVFSISEKGKLKHEKPTVTLEISKAEFDNYIEELN